MLDDCPPAINISEKELTRKERTILAQHRSGHCRLIGSYKSRISKDVSLDVCADCDKTPHNVKHLFNCPAHPTTVRLMDQTCGRNPGTRLSRGWSTRLKGEQQPQHEAYCFLFITQSASLASHCQQRRRMTPPRRTDHQNRYG